MTKPFYTYEQQLYKLKSEKELIIPDTDYAVDVLKHFSYYSLINGYKELFKHKPSGKFLRGVSFEEIVAFYNFDEQLRTLFLKYILHIEKQIKSIISYSFCEKHGSNQCEYINPSNYNITSKNTTEINKLTKSLHSAISLPTHYSYIKHHITKYKNVPLWVAMNAFTFGQVAKMYQYLPSDIRTSVSLNFDHINETELHQFIRIIANCRNVCAHGERLYSFHVMEHISDMPLHKKLNITILKGHYVCGTNDLFAVVIALRYLLSKSKFKKFKYRLTRLITAVLHNCPHLSSEQLLFEMGFPSNWISITRYKL